MEINTLPNHRIFDEKSVLLCSRNPKQVLELLRKHNYQVHYCLLLGNMETWTETPLVTIDWAKKESGNLRIIIDDHSLTERDIIRVQEIAGCDTISLDQLHESHPDRPIACASQHLYLSITGDLYPCPRMLDREPICNIGDMDRLDKIRAYDPWPCSCKRGYAVRSSSPLTVDSLSIELGGRCNGDCVYCYERLNSNCRAHRFAFETLSDFLDEICCTKITVAGGEVMHQPKTLKQLERLRLGKPGLFIGLKTNGFSNEPERAMRLFDHILVSINSFNSTNLKMIMGQGVEIATLKFFCEAIADIDGNKLELKFLVTPLTVGDFSEFIKWAIPLQPKEISVTKAMLFGGDLNPHLTGSSFYGLNPLYWETVFKRNATKTRHVLDTLMAEYPDTKIRFGQGTKALLVGAP